MAPTTLENGALNRTKEPFGSIEPTRRLTHCGREPARGEFMPALAMNQDQTALASALASAHSTTAGIAILTDQLQAIAASLVHMDCDCLDAATWIAFDTALASVHVALIVLGDLALHDTEAGARTDRPTDNSDRRSTTPRPLSEQLLGIRSERVSWLVCLEQAELAPP